MLACDIGGVPFATWFRIGSKRCDAWAAVSGQDINVGIAPRIDRYCDITQVRAIPTRVPSLIGNEGFKTRLGAGVLADVKKVEVEGGSQSFDLRGRRLDFGAIEVSDDLGRDETGQHGQDAHYDQEFDKAETGIPPTSFRVNELRVRHDQISYFEGHAGRYGRPLNSDAVWT